MRMFFWISRNESEGAAAIKFCLLMTFNVGFTFLTDKKIIQPSKILNYKK